MTSEDVRPSLLRELAGRVGGVWVTCAGRSMEPTVKLGDRVRVESCARLRAGEVALFEARRGGRPFYVLHRVICQVPGTPWFVHIGDAGSPQGPGLFHAQQLIGRAVVARRLPDLPTWMIAARRVLDTAARRACSF